MTGEVTLQGRVLPIGGVKQKVLAAHRAGLKEVILPKRNEGDLDDVPEQVRDEIVFHPVETVDEVLALALEREGSVVPSVAERRRQGRAGRGRFEDLRAGRRDPERARSRLPGPVRRPS